MDLKKTLDVLNAMEADRIIGRYAIAGAVAAYRYLEPTLTQDLDVLVSFEPKAALISLDSIYSYLKARGFESFENEGIVVGGWPVQFIPVTDRLDAEALADAVEVEIAVHCSAHRPAEGSHSHHSVHGKQKRQYSKLVRCPATQRIAG
jgi:hypothetical protein